MHGISAVNRSAGRPGPLVGGAGRRPVGGGRGCRRGPSSRGGSAAQSRPSLGSAPSHPRHFVTEPGLGYRFEP